MSKFISKFFVFLTVLLLFFVIVIGKINANDNNYYVDYLDEYCESEGLNFNLNLNNYYIPLDIRNRVYDKNINNTSFRTTFVTFKRFRPLFYWNYHRAIIQELNYSDRYVLEKLFSIEYNGGASTFTLASSQTVSSTKSYGFKFAPEVEGIKLFEFSRLESTTVEETIGGSWTVSINPNSKKGFYGFYATIGRRKNNLDHKYSKSSKDYDIPVQNQDFYLYKSNVPDFAFIYSGTSPLL